MDYDIPVLLVFFNRPNTTWKVFEEIKKCRPSKLYLASDGPRESKKGEKEIVLKLREEIVKRINWTCEVKTLFQDKNIGCSLGVKTAIDWMFNNEKYGIILEDDCVVQESFWLFVEEILKKYEYDQRIGMVAGYNPINLHDYKFSYIFSHYKSCWGWATWKRAWENMDLQLKWRNSNQCSDIISNSGLFGKDISENKYKILKIDSGFVSAWDWQWYFSLAAQNQLCIHPRVSLVSNIGTGEGATHTAHLKLSDTITSYNLDFPLIHPDYIVASERFEKLFHKNLYSLKRRIRNCIPFSLYSFLYNLFYKK